MTLLHLVAGILLATGGTIITIQVLRKPSPFGFLVDRRIDPHLWGFHFLGAGCLLSLALMILREPSWHRLDAVGRVAVAGSVVWIVAAILISVFAILARDRGGAPRPLLPSPDTRPRTWSPSYRAFLALGFAALGALAVISF